MELQIFNNEEFGDVRVVMKNDIPWFVAADVCRVLELTNPTVALERLDDDEKAKFNLGLPGGETNVINESVPYALTLTSRKPNAKKFRKWVTAEVVPSIRKHGAYMTPETIEKVLYNPDFIIKLATELKAEREKMPYSNRKPTITTRF